MVVSLHKLITFSAVSDILCYKPSLAPAGGGVQLGCAAGPEQPGAERDRGCEAEGDDRRPGEGAETTGGGVGAEFMTLFFSKS